MARNLLGFLLVASVAVWPAAGLHSQGVRGTRRTKQIKPLFPEGQIPFCCIDANDAGRTEEILSSQIRTPETLQIDKNCNINGSLADLYYHVTEPGLEMDYVLKDPSSRAAVVVVPGGGWVYEGGWDKEGRYVAEWLNSLGISAPLLKYRVPSLVGRKLPVADLQRAMSILRSDADKLGIDPERIGVIGFSAGGGIIAEVFSSPRKYQRIDDIDDVPCKPNFQMSIYGVSSPAWIDVPGPTFIAQAADDPCVPAFMGRIYCDALKASNHSCTRHLYPNGGHGIGVCAGKWKYGVPHPEGHRGWDGQDGWFNTWSGDALCAWPREAQNWLEQIGILQAPPA